jgi:hypothetical protein
MGQSRQTVPSTKPLMVSKDDFHAQFAAIGAEWESLKQEHADNPDKLAEADEAMKSKVRGTFGEWERLKSMGLLDEARRLHIDLPSVEEKDAWVGLDGSFGLPFLSNKGLLMRRGIDEEKSRRREVAAWWWKTVIIPTLTILVGLIGALTGFVAVLHHK